MRNTTLFFKNNIMGQIMQCSFGNFAKFQNPQMKPSGSSTKK